MPLPESSPAAPAASEPAHMLSHWLVTAAIRTPDAIAIEDASATRRGSEPAGDGVVRLSYAGLAARTDALAVRLHEAGIVRGDLVGIAADRGIDAIVAILACVQMGAGYVPFDLGYPADRLRAMLDDARPRVVLGSAQALDRLGELVGELPSLAQPAPRSTATQDLTYVLFTSGSTGRPKGVAMGPRPLAHLIDWHAAHPLLGKPARTLQFAPLSFDVHFQEIFSTLACGGTLVLIADAQRRDPRALHEALNQHRVERVFMPYVALQMVADASRDQVPAWLREVISAGEQLQVTPAIRSLFRRLRGASLHNHYGPTESHVVTAHELTGNVDDWPDIPPIGRALPHVALALGPTEADTDSGTGAPDGTRTGELLLGGDTLAHGYLGRDDLTAERFRTDPPGLSGRWYATGDLVRMDASGCCTYLGRIDQQLKVDGFRIEAGEVELTLMRHPAVREAVVTAPELPGSGRQLVAHLVLNEGADLGASTLAGEMRRHLRGRLPDFMVPVRYVCLERLPTTPSGKIDRRALPAPVVATSRELPQAGVPEQIRLIWQELLGQDRIDDHRNLFDLGARSLLVMRFVSRLRDLGVEQISVADVYDRPTLAALIERARGRHGDTPAAGTARRKVSRTEAPDAPIGIAIVGMAARAPGARSLDEFWSNLLAGREGIRHFAPHELDPSVPESLRSRPNFVAARGVLDDADRFDAAFFGISAREALMLDPQQRVLLETCWTALEHAGIRPDQPGGTVGVFAGTANNSYAPALREARPELVQQFGEFAAMLASEKDYVATRIANRLNLKGPAISIHTACSTGLVAVGQAWHALASGQCDVALAGGATVVVPQQGGYLHVEGAMESADGHCRPFDAQASGTVFASASAAVVLKRLDDALADGDTVHAVIRGVGINNDGADKASFTAPSVTGQAEAIRMALDHAGVNARSIGYVEAHGTGTALGDPIEIAALTRAWQPDTTDHQFCLIGSAKSNIGHTIAAAGVLGLIKAALSLHHECIAPTIHFREPNPQLDLARSPFKVVDRLTPWPRGSQPRRAAVSSFGVGGTNAHVILEEAPQPLRAHAADMPPASALPWVLPLSARTAEAVRRRAADLADHLQAHPELALTDVAATLMRGRQDMARRLAVVAADAPAAIQALRSVSSATSAPVAAWRDARLVFLFPGQGAQHPGMARGLHGQFGAFRDAFDAVLAAAGPELAADLRHWMVECLPDDDAAAKALADTRHAQIALFAMSYALAVWLDSLGVRPAAMIGHSIGELAAACRAGVFSLDDAVRAVVARGQAMGRQARGGMLAVRCGVAALPHDLPAGLEIAAENAPGLTVLAGPLDAISAAQAVLESRQIGCTALRVSHAFHSAAMDGALPEFTQALTPMALAPAAVPVYSCVTGQPLTAAQATNPHYWAQQIRATVRFSQALQAELGAGPVVLVEVGPGQALSALVRQHRLPDGSVPRVVPLLAQATAAGDPVHHALAALGSLWCAGVPVAWPVPASARRACLPTYPFAGERHWFEPAAAAASPVSAAALSAPASASIEVPPMNSRLPRLELELKRILGDVSGLSPDELAGDASFVDQGLDSLSLTQATLELERVFGLKLRFRRLLEDLDTIAKLAGHLDAELPADRFRPAAPASTSAPSPAVTATPAAAPAAPQAVATLAPMAMAPGASLPGLQQLIAQQMQLMSQQLALLAGQSVLPPVDAVPAAAVSTGTMAHPATVQPTQASAQAAVEPPAATSVQPATAPDAETTEPGTRALVDKPFGASARITLKPLQHMSTPQQAWLEAFIERYNQRTGRSKTFSQQHRRLMADPRVVTGFNPLWKDLVYPIVVDRSKGASMWDIDGNEYIDLLSCFGANLLGYQPDELVQAMKAQLDAGIEVGPQHPLSAEVAALISEFTGMPRVAFCNTGSEAVMGAMRIARTVTGRKTIAIFTNSYHGIFDEVIVRGTKQLRSLSAAPGILANAVENVLVLDWASEDSLRVLRERGHELAAIMTEPIQNKYPTLQPREFVQALRRIADDSGCALIFDEVVTGFRVAPGGAQEFYGVRADIATYGKIIGGGLPFAAIAGGERWLDALDGGHWQYGDESYPEAGVTYFAGTFVRHPLALAAARASLLHLKRGGRELYRTLNGRTQHLIDRLNTAFAVRGAPVKAVHCASLWRLQWDDDQKYVSLFYYLVRHHGLHLYEQFGHFVTEAMDEPVLERIFSVFTDALDELMALGFITPREGSTPPPAGPGGPGADRDTGASPADPAPLTPGQTERWLAASFDENARRALNESLCLELEGPVDHASLDAALIDVMNRHEAFRIRFDATEPLQSLAVTTRPKVHAVDLSDQPDAQAALDQFCEQASLHCFDLDQAPLVRTSVLRLAGGRTVVHLVMSHLVFDGWATPVFLQDLATAYRARSAGLTPQWPAAESPRRFAADEQARWDGPEGAQSMAYWREQLRQPPAPLTLGDREPPSPRQFSGDTLRERIEGELLAQLQPLARQHKATMFQLLLAAVTEAVYRRTGRDDFLISIPFASQSLERHGPLIADGVLDLPLRLRRGTGATFSELIAHVRNQLMDALEHPLATQGSVARAVGVTSVGSRPPLTGVFFNLNPRLDVRGFEPLQARVHEGRKLGLLGEVIFNFYETPDALTLDLHHSTEFFSPQRARELVDALVDVLREVSGSHVQAPSPASPFASPSAPSPASTPATAAGGVSADDLVRLARWNATDTAYETGLRLGDLIARTVAATPQAVAVRFEGRSVSYAELDRMAWALAHRLRAQGIRPGDLVGVCLERSVELVAALVGVIYSGGAYVPLDPAYPRERLTHMCEDARMRVVVTREAELAKAGAAFPAGTEVIHIDGGLGLSPTAVNTLVGTPDDPAYVIFTSGSTGRPKGAMNAHAGIVNRLQWMQQEYQLTPADRVMQKTPYSFDVSVWEFFWPLMTGATVVVARPEGHRDAAYLAQLIADEQVTVMHFVPSMLRLFLEEPRADQCRSLRQVVCSGEALPLDAVDRFFETLPQVKLGNLYGPTEAAVDVTCWNCIPGDPRRLVPIGRPIANTRMYVLGEQLELLPVGQEGELYIGGVQVGMGYVSRPDLTAERFLPDPFHPGGRMYKTGDVGRWLDDGVIEYLGRADHQVKLRGFRIELGEIEAQLMSSPAISRCVVVARDFGGGDHRLVAYVVPRLAMPDASELKAHLSRALPEYMVPQIYVPMGDIPLLPNGKIDRKALPAPPLPSLPSGSGTQALQGDLQHTLAAIMTPLLKLPAIGPSDDFFALGGHSLLAARVIAQVNKQLGTQLTLRSLFEAPTIEKLAAAIEAQRDSTQPALVREPIVHRAEQGDAPLTVAQERIRFIEELHPGRVVYNAPSAHRLTGPIDPAAFDQAFSEMIRRQPVLRTVIVRDGAQSVQRVVDVKFSLLPLEDLSMLPASEREAVLMQRLEALTAQTFELDQAPLFKARLFKLGDHEHALFFMTHHIIWDGWSFDVLYAEISALYEDALAGRAPSLAPLPVTYGDYAVWHNQWLKGPELAAQVAWWKKQFAQGAMPRPAQGDFPRQLATRGRGATEWMHIDTAQVERVRELAKQTGSTLSMVVLSVYAALMSQWLRDPCPAIGMPVRGRTQAELEGVMGFFNNMLPVRLPVDTRLSGRDWIRKVREIMVGAFACQDAPFELLAAELDAGAANGPTHLYQVMFSFQDARARQTHWGPLAHERIPLLQKGATEDINLWMVEIPSGIEGGVQYNADLFLPGTAALLRDRLLAAVEALVADPDRPVADLLQASADDRRTLQDWARPQGAALPWPAPLPDFDDLQQVVLADGHRTLRASTLRQALAAGEQALRAALPQPDGLLLIDGRDRLMAAVVELAALRAGVKQLAFARHGLPQADSTRPSDVRVAAVAGAAGATAGWSARAALIDPWTWPGLAAALGEPPVAPPAAGEGVAWPAIETVHTSALAQVLGSLATSVRLLPGDTVACPDALPGAMRRLWLQFALQAQARCLLGADALTADATRFAQAVEFEGLALAQLDGPTWRQLLQGRGSKALPMTAVVNVAELDVDLVEALQAAGATVLSFGSGPDAAAGGLPLAAMVLSGASDALVFGRPLLDGVAVCDAQGQPVPPGVPGELRLAGVATGMPVRWRADGKLQYLGEPSVPDTTRPAAPAQAGSRQPVAAGATATVTSAVSPTEAVLIEVWQQVLGLRDITPADNFFDLGGTSLLVMQAMNRLQARLGRQVTPRRFVFETLGQIAAAYDGGEPPADAAAAADALGSSPVPTPPAAPRSMMRRLAELVRRS